jgi:hypothetical protein
MPRVASIVLLAGCGAIFLHAQSEACAPPGALAPVLVANPDLKVTFHCEPGAPLDLIRAVGRQTRTPIGIALGRDSTILSKANRSFDLDRVDAKSALLLAIQDTGYSLKEDNHVLVLTAGDLTPRQSGLLTHFFPGIKPMGPNPTMIDLSFDLTMWIRAAVDPHRGWGASISTSSNEERFTSIGTLAGTTEQIADRIVSLGSKGLWIFKADSIAPVPGAMADDQLFVEPYQHHSNRP